MHGRSDAEQKATRSIAAGADERHGQHTKREANNPVRILRSQQKETVDRAVLGCACEKNQRRRADRDERVVTECVDHHRQRLERHHAEYAAQDERQANFREAGREQWRADLVQQRPQLDVIDEKGIAVRVLDEAGQHLRRFNRHLPVGEAGKAGAKPHQAADRQNPERMRRRRGNSRRDFWMCAGSSQNATAV